MHIHRSDGNAYFPTAPEGEFLPTPDQVLEIQQILSQILPPELSFPILEYAGYPPPVIAERTDTKVYTARFGNNIWDLHGREEARREFEDYWFYLETDELWGNVRKVVPASSSRQDEDETEADSLEAELSQHEIDETPQVDGTPPVDSVWWIKEIVVTTTSRDQGWSDTPEHRGTYNQSYTWFDIAIKRPITPGGPFEYLPGDFEVQRNKHAHPVWETHTVTLPLDDPFFQRLRTGDVLVLLAKSRYPVSLSRINVKNASCAQLLPCHTSFRRAGLITSSKHSSRRDFVCHADLIPFTGLPR
jgi:hypothetical protein